MTVLNQDSDGSSTFQNPHVFGQAMVACVDSHMNLISAVIVLGPACAGPHAVHFMYMIRATLTLSTSRAEGTIIFPHVRDEEPAAQRP